MFDSCTKQTKITTAIVIGVTVLCIIGEILFLVLGQCSQATDIYVEDVNSICKLNLWLTLVIIALPSLIGFIILGIRIWLDRREASSLDQEAQGLNTQHIVK